MRRGLLGLLLVPLLLAPVGVASATTTPEPCGSPIPFNRANFPHGELVTNKWLPLTPGTQFVLRGTVDGKSHEIVTTVTDLTKMVDGVRTIVVLDQDLGGGQLQEAEIALFAQDKHGAVRALGEYPELYQNGQFVGAPDTWITGIAGAVEGTAMLAHPHVGAPSYLQGRAPAIEFEDCGKVFKTGQDVCVPTGCYHNVLVTDEWAPLDPTGGHHHKFYAAGLGTIRVDAIGDVNPEVLQLAKVKRLCPGALSKMRAEALKLDKRGYQVSPDVYAHTSPATRTLAAGPC